MDTFSNVAVAAAEIAAIRDLEFQVPERGNGRRMGNLACLNRSV